MATHTNEHGHAGNEKWASEHHIAPVQSYFKVFGGLIVLTILTVGTAKGVALHPHVLNIVLAMVIAFAKACLVILYFMHQKYETTMNRMILISGFIALALLLGITGIDELTRYNVKPDPRIFQELEKGMHQ